MPRAANNSGVLPAAELYDFSPSRLNVASRCGLAFSYQYVRHLPAPWDRAASLLGTAVHRGTQQWYELPNDGFKQADLAPIILAEFEALWPPAIWEGVKRLRNLDAECEAVAGAILFRRPELRAVRQTVEFQKSAAAKAFSDASGAIMELCDKLPEVKWPKDEDPYRQYKMAAKWGASMQRRWQDKPRPIVVEYPFVVEIAGFRVRGAIDQVRVDPDRHGEARPYMIDIKSGRNPLTAMEAFLQSFLYTEACHRDPQLPDTSEVAFYLTRKDQYQQGRIDRARHLALATRILNGRARQIVMGAYEPSYGHWCKMCDFHDLCRAEISLWIDGSDNGLVSELMD